MGQQSPGCRGNRRRRPRGHQRSRSVRVRFSEEEYLAVSAAAERLGLAVGAYAGAATLAAATRADPPEWSPLTELLGELMCAAGQARRIGVNLNQAVAALHSLGYPTMALGEYARVATRSIRNMDEVAEQIRKRLA
ncbi:hypothetical protein ACFQ07_33370 [Actinomadura adrarensis]|uniref:Plasmid mobilization relaxosome protein MobC n=1 Tax=Actinomadura adrarensis TaxID=1819600 RepID=A0ABW3CRL1_9ACTN